MNYTQKVFHGQAILMVVVAMVIILSVSLSVATRSFINVHTTTEEAKSNEAFSAAEAGIEKYLQAPTPFIGPVGTSDVTVSKQDIGGTGSTQILLNNGAPVLKDDGADVWLSAYPGFTSPLPSGTVLSFYWGTTNDCSSAAIEVLFIQGTVANPTVTRRVWDPCSARASVNHFNSLGAPSVVNVNILGVPFKNSAAFTLTSTGLLARVIPLYSNSVIAATLSTNFPLQGSIVSSTGSSGGTQRKITVYKGYPKIPNEFFSYTIFSP